MEAHFSVVTAFSLTPCGLKGVSCGRDAVCVVWDLTSHIKVSIVPVFRMVKWVVMMDNRRKVVLTTGDNVAVWDQ